MLLSEIASVKTMSARTVRAPKIAQWLKAHPLVDRVLHPALPDCPGHAIWKRDFTGGCGLFSMVLAGRGAAERARFVDALELFGIGFSWGGFESLVLPITPKTYRSLMPCPTGGKPAIRLSIGLEDSDDLIADLAQALAAA